MNREEVTLLGFEIVCLCWRCSFKTLGGSEGCWKLVILLKRDALVEKPEACIAEAHHAQTTC